MAPKVPLFWDAALMMLGLRVSVLAEFLPGPIRLLLGVAPLVLLHVTLLPRALPTDRAGVWGALPGGHLLEAWWTQNPGVRDSFSVGGFPGTVGCWG